MTMAHLGLGLWMLGVAFATGYSFEKDVRLGPGESAEMAGYRFQFERLSQAEGPNYQADRGEMTVYQGERSLGPLYPEKRYYPSQGSVMTETGVDIALWRDLYVALGEPINKAEPAGDWSFRLYYKPMIRYVWLGGLLMFIGGLIAICDRRYRLASQASSERTGNKVAAV
jgi:cytochrome c-type biogenesis protein CcmF